MIVVDGLAGSFVVPYGRTRCLSSKWDFSDYALPNINRLLHRRVIDAEVIAVPAQKSTC